MSVTETWVIDTDGAGGVTSGTVLEMLRERIAGGSLETWLTSSSGRLLAFVTNTERAMVLLLDHEDAPAEHAATPGAEGASAGFVLANGQHDAYPDEDTVPIGEALTLVEHIVRTGSWPAQTCRVADH